MNSSTEKNQVCRDDAACEFKDNLEILRQIDFFSALPLEALKVVAYLSSRESFKPGEYLFHQDDVDGQAFYIISGKLRLTREEDSGEVLFGTFDSGDFFGGLALLADMSRLFSLKVEEEVSCIVFTRDKFAKIIEQFPNTIPRLLESVVNGVVKWEKQFLSGHADTCKICSDRLGVSLV